MLSLSPFFDINKYSDFLPWCANSKIISQESEEIIASLDIAYHGVNQSFSSKNTGIKNQEIVMKLVDGPFKHLDGLWVFSEIDGDSCKIDFSLDFEFNNFLLHKIASPIFSKIANTMLDSFISRAEDIYG